MPTRANSTTIGSGAGQRAAVTPRVSGTRQLSTYATLARTPLGIESANLVRLSPAFALLWSKEGEAKVLNIAYFARAVMREDLARRSVEAHRPNVPLLVPLAFECSAQAFDDLEQRSEALGLCGLVVRRTAPTEGRASRVSERLRAG